MSQRVVRHGSSLRPEFAASFLEDKASSVPVPTDPTEFSDSDSDDDDPSLGFERRRADSVPEGIDASSHLSLGSRRNRSAVSSLSKSDVSLSTDDESGRPQASASAEQSVPQDGSESSVTDGAVSSGTDIHGSPQGVDILSFDCEQAPGQSGLPAWHRRPSVMTISSSLDHSTQNLDDPNELAAHVASKVKMTFELKCSEQVRPARRESKTDILAPFLSKEIVLGKLLGSGEFSHAFEIKSFTLKSIVRESEEGDDGDANGEDGAGGREEHVLLSDSTSGSSADRTLTGFEVSARLNMKSRERYRETAESKATGCRYALKHLRPTLIEKYDSLDYAQAASDLVMEAEFLGRLVHPNIIKIR